MNIVQLQEQLKNFSQDQLVREMQMPSGTAPQFLVLGEIMRRQKMQQDFANRQAQGAPQSTVAEDAIASAGVPQGGIADMARALAPKTNMTENTGVQAMAAGGPVKKMAPGGAVKTDPAVRAMASRLGMSVDEYLRSVGEEQAARIAQDAERRALRERMKGFEPVGDGITFPTQEDLDRRFAESQTREPSFPVSGFSEPGPEYMGFGGQEGAPPRRPGSATEIMTSMPQAIFAAQDRGGRAGMTDALLASAYPGIRTADIMPPDPFEVAKATAAAQPPYMPGPAAATELNLPMVRAALARDGGAGMATGLRAAAQNYTPPAAAPAAADPMLAFQEDFGMTASGAPAPRATSPAPAGDPMLAFQENFDVGLDAGPPAGVMERIFGADALERAGFDTSRTPERPAQTTGTPLEVPQGGGKELLPPEAQAQIAAEEAAKTSTDPAGSGGTGAGGAGGAGGMSSYEQELMDVLGRREKAAEQDKWLALAQVGLNLMSSTQPTLMGALGEAGLKGVEAARGARDQYDKDRIELLGALEQSRMARAAAAAKAARGAGGLTEYQAATLGRYARQDAISMLGTLYDRLGTLAPGGIPVPQTADEYARTKAQIAAIENDLYGDVGTEAGESYDLTQ